MLAWSSEFVDKSQTLAFHGPTPAIVFGIQVREVRLSSPYLSSHPSNISRKHWPQFVVVPMGSMRVMMVRCS